MPLYGEAKRRYQREMLARRRQAWLDGQGGACVRCSSTDRLEIDHIDPSLKEAPIATLWSRTQAVRDVELAKCQVLCHECHQEKTYGMAGVKHGTTTGYGHHKCRCDPCRGAHAIAERRRRAKQPTR